MRSKARGGVLVAVLYSGLGNQLSSASAALVAARLTKRALILEFGYHLPVQQHPPGLLLMDRTSSGAAAGLATLGFSRLPSGHLEAPEDRRPRSVPGRAALWNVDSPSELAKLALGQHPGASEPVLVATFGGRDLLAKAATKEKQLGSALRQGLLSSGSDMRDDDLARAVVRNPASKHAHPAKATEEWVRLSGILQACALAHLLHRPAASVALPRDTLGDPAWASGLVVAVHVRLGDGAFLQRGSSDDRRMPLHGMARMWQEAQAAGDELAASAGVPPGAVRFFIAGDSPAVTSAAQDALGSGRVLLSAPGPITMKMIGSNASAGPPGLHEAGRGKMVQDLLFLSRAAALIQTCTSFADKASLMGRHRIRVVCTWAGDADRMGSCRKAGWAEISKC